MDADAASGPSHVQNFEPTFTQHIQYVCPVRFTFLKFLDYHFVSRFGKDLVEEPDATKLSKSGNAAEQLASGSPRDIKLSMMAGTKAKFDSFLTTLSESAR